MQPEELTDQSIDYILDNTDLTLCSEWERNFIESVTDQWTRNRKLSEKQKEILGNIWDKQP
jgi:hypothetical protein